MADPVAAKSSFLCMYMSNHPDTLVAYVKHYGKVKEAITTAQLTAIDTTSMSLTYTVKGGEKKEVRIPLDPPLSGYEEVKPRLLAMKADAQEALGMIKAPQIDKFYPPPPLFSSFPIVVLGITTLSAFSTSPWLYPGRVILNALGGWITMKYILATVAGLHFLEALYTLSLCWRHRTPLLVGTQYVLTTFVLGFPTWVELRKRVQAARIDSVMKIQ